MLYLVVADSRVPPLMRRFVHYYIVVGIARVLVGYHGKPGILHAAVDKARLHDRILVVRVIAEVFAEGVDRRDRRIERTLGLGIGRVVIIDYGRAGDAAHLLELAEHRREVAHILRLDAVRLGIARFRLGLDRAGERALVLGGERHVDRIVRHLAEKRIAHRIVRIGDERAVAVYARYRVEVREIDRLIGIAEAVLDVGQFDRVFDINLYPIGRVERLTKRNGQNVFVRACYRHVRILAVDCDLSHLEHGITPAVGESLSKLRSRYRAVLRALAVCVGIKMKPQLGQRHVGLIDVIARHRRGERVILRQRGGDVVLGIRLVRRRRTARKRRRKRGRSRRKHKCRDLLSHNKLLFRTRLFV